MVSNGVQRVPHYDYDYESWAYKKEGNTQNATQNRELYKSKPNERKKVNWQLFHTLNKSWLIDQKLTKSLVRVVD